VGEALLLKNKVVFCKVILDFLMESTLHSTTFVYSLMEIRVQVNNNEERGSATSISRSVKTLAICCTSALLLTACAKSSNEIATTYVSPEQYRTLDCNQISSELVRVSSRVADLGGRLDEAASNDAAITGVGMILFWPALFALGGTDAQEAEYGRLKGEYEALNQLSVQKNCMGTQQAESAGAASSGNIIESGPNSSNVAQATEQCKAQGIPVGTEQFGKCVLNLSR